ncbi:MAG: SMC family ATPase, partial [Deltaproteobacteria bacterium]|nr:SMC family ATPase [Deltaproteobacteria bacterium]
MEIKQLTIQGFKSFDNAQTIDFTKMESGFYFITGENKVEPRLGANGVGKSSIWDALCWVLYGKVSTSARASTYKNWHGKKPCKVILDFNHHGQDYHLERTWSPNTLKLATNPITQEELTAIIGLDFSAFLYTIFVSQFSSKFFDLSPADKLGIFSEVLDLDKWKG